MCIRDSLIIEAIRRKPISQKYEIAINAAGFILLIGLMIFATFKDVYKRQLQILLLDLYRSINKYLKFVL